MLPPHTSDSAQLSVPVLTLAIPLLQDQALTAFPAMRDATHNTSNATLQHGPKNRILAISSTHTCKG